MNAFAKYRPIRRLAAASVVFPLLVTPLPAQTSLLSDGIPIEKPPAPITLGVMNAQKSANTRSVPTHSYDVQHYDVLLNLVESLSQLNHVFSGEVTIKLVVRKAGFNSVDLHARDLTVDSIAIDGVPAPSVQPVNGVLDVPLGRAYAPGDTIALMVGYTNDSTADLGYYFYPKGSGAGALVADEHIAYTMSEPYDARYWLPCYDEPYDKAAATMRVVVPKGYVVASNGILENVTDDGMGQQTYTWNQLQPVATYLMAITVSPFTVSSTGYTKSTSPFETIPVEYYVWKADSAVAAGFLPTVVDMIDFYAGIFGEYPYDKYGMSGIAPFSYGGMEHTTITTLRRNYVTNVSVVAHELVHQWWGDLVTCGTWADIWLNEGFATYGDALYSEHTGGSQALQTRMSAFAQAVFSYDRSNRHPIYDPLEYTTTLFNVNEYQKGAWVLHMLRGLLGDSTFFAIFPAYGEKFRFGNAVTDDFIALVDSVAGQDLSWFFNQWVYGQGYPEYEYSWTDLGRTVRISVDQVQTNAPTFKMPVEFLIQTGGGDVTEVVWDSLKAQEFDFAVPGPVTAVTFDPNNKILKKATGVGSGPLDTTDIPAAFRLHQNYPNPFNPTTTVEYDVPRKSFVTVAVYDLLGRKVADLVSQVLEPGFYRAPFSAEGLASGVYFCRLEAVDLSTNATIRVTETRSMVILR